MNSLNMVSIAKRRNYIFGNYIFGQFFFFIKENSIGNTTYIFGRQHVVSENVYVA